MDLMRVAGSIKPRELAIALLFGPGCGNPSALSDAGNTPVWGEMASRHRSRLRKSGGRVVGRFGRLNRLCQFNVILEADHQR